MNTSDISMASIFNEWARRYAANPEEFSDILGEDGKPVADYGELCVRFYRKLESEGVGDFLFMIKEQQPGGPVDFFTPSLGDEPVAETKKLRQFIKDLHECLSGSGRKSRSRSIAITKLEEASMWLGKDLQELNEPNPYPRSHDPKDPVIDATAPDACAIPSA